MTATPLRVLLAEDHTLVRKGIRAVLRQVGWIDVIAEAADGREALELARLHGPDVVVMDIAMPGLNGLEATARITKESPRTRVLILSMHATEEYVAQALRAGASGYLLKGADVPEFELALKAVARGDPRRSGQPRVLSRVTGGSPPKFGVFPDCRTIGSCPTVWAVGLGCPQKVTMVGPHAHLICGRPQAAVFSAAKSPLRAAKTPYLRIPSPAMLHPHPGTSPYRPMTVDPVARGTEHEPRVEAEVQRAALSQLLKGGPLAEALHVVLVLVVAALVWNSLPLALTIGWVGAVTAAAGLPTL